MHDTAKWYTLQIYTNTQILEFCNPELSMPTLQQLNTNKK